MAAKSLEPHVPVSVSTLSGKKIDQANLNNLEDISTYIPNVTISQNVNTSNLFIRGIGSGVNQGFEQSVGTFLDGVYMGRTYQSRAPLFDLAAVEVLKGPQGILFGKNTIAGALVVTTAKPTDEFEGSVSALYEPDHGEKVMTGVLSGPLSDTVSARLAVRKESLDGYLDNTFTGEEGPSKDNRILRTSIRWLANQNLEINAKLEDATFDLSGMINQAFAMTPAHLALVQNVDPAENGVLYHLTIPTLTPANLPEFLAKTYLLAFAI